MPKGSAIVSSQLGLVDAKLASTTDVCETFVPEFLENGSRGLLEAGGHCRSQYRNEIAHTGAEAHRNLTQYSHYHEGKEVEIEKKVLL
jgi:hypothetical protein